MVVALIHHYYILDMMNMLFRFLKAPLLLCIKCQVHLLGFPPVVVMALGNFIQDTHYFFYQN